VGVAVGVGVGVGVTVGVAVKVGVGVGVSVEVAVGLGVGVCVFGITTGLEELPPHAATPMHKTAVRQKIRTCGFPTTFWEAITSIVSFWQRFMKSTAKSMP
jgi:hypothetical protein